MALIIVCPSGDAAYVLDDKFFSAMGLAALNETHLGNAPSQSKPGFDETMIVAGHARTDSEPWWHFLAQFFQGMCNQFFTRGFFDLETLSDEAVGMLRRILKDDPDREGVVAHRDWRGACS
jgi:hypothetical protein